MGWVNDAVAELAQRRPVQIQPFGGSMRGRIESGQLVTLEPVDPASLREHDAVLVRWRGNCLLHIIKQIDGDNVLIGNNIGKINGWAKCSDVLGRVTNVVDEPLTTATVLSQKPNLTFQVQLEDGAEVTATVRKDAARLMFRVVPGDRVIVGGLWNQQYQIKSFAPA